MIYIKDVQHTYPKKFLSFNFRYFCIYLVQDYINCMYAYFGQNRSSGFWTGTSESYPPLVVYKERKFLIKELLKPWFSKNQIRYQCQILLTYSFNHLTQKHSHLFDIHIIKTIFKDLKLKNYKFSKPWKLRIFQIQNFFVKKPVV